MLAGVCGGLGEYFGIDSSLVRLGLVCLIVFGGTGFLAYILAWIIIPEAPYDYDAYRERRYESPNTQPKRDQDAEEVVVEAKSEDGINLNKKSHSDTGEE